MAPLRLVFMGSPDFGVPVLSALLEAGHEIICVYAQRHARPAAATRNAPARCMPSPRSTV